ncbi:uncharacterized protein K02A2.6-like, partial [Protobothrops mucrosquamatus]|uniref:uncharacterized protein K02A2.6-like n=1 Tax=Protobothrops mucrosquamatus TaxID=103944 RepID=UPI0010FAD641
LINGKSTRLQFDTASDITLISKSTWNHIGRPLVISSIKEVRNASGDELNLTGEIHCDISFNGVQTRGICYLTDRPNLNLLGIDWIEKLGLFDVPVNKICNQLQVKKAHTSSVQGMMQLLRQKFATIFEDGLGHCTKFKASLSLKPGVKPVFKAKRPVPYAAIQSVNDELDRLQKSGVIQPVNYSPWAAPIVAVKKASGKVRICADFSTGLNTSLEDHQYPLPIPEDIFAKLNGGTCFAKLDLSDAYHQVDVADDSKELLTINTHRGLFQFNRLPFGVKSAPAIFQQLMDTMLTGIAGAAAYLDDIILMGRTKEDLFETMNAVFSRIQDYGLRIREEKCNFFMPSIKYLGFILDKDGRRPDPENIEAIQKMPPPKDLPTLRSFLGLISHYSTFLPEMHRLRTPLNQLLVKDQPWNWSQECQNVFNKVKSMLKSNLLLTHFNPALDIVVAADASNSGVGAVISHVFPDGQKAISHAARSLTAAERNYSQIEKEALAIIFAVKKFHKMLYGRRFTLLTDHKPLLAIFGSKKGIPVYTANRLQRWALILLGYDFEIRYQSTTSFGQADALSRLIGSQHQEPEETVIAAISTEPDVNFIVADALRSMPVTADEVREATLQDPTLKRVAKFLHSTWPTACDSDELRQFFHRKNSLSIVNDCIMFAERVVIPKKLQTRVLQQFHMGHPGINRMKALARSYVYWPFIDQQLEGMVKSCFQCASASKMPIKAELSSWPIPEKPWSRVHIDYAGPVNGQSFLVAVDAFSKWPEVFLMDSTTTSSTVAKLNQLFSRFGAPETIVSDNGTQFTSAHFELFCKRNGINHVRSPPFHPQSNGQAERFVDTFKRALQKSKGEGTTADLIERFLLMYRATPNPQSPGGVSPAEALMNRKLRMPFDVIRPATIPTRRNQVMERQFNRRHGAIPRMFAPGESVLVRDYRKQHYGWIPGTILRKRGRVLYDVQVGSQVWTRHVNQLRPTRCQVHQNQKRLLQFDLLLEEFSLPKTPQAEENQQTPCQHETSQKPMLPRRWTDRKRVPSRRLQVNPKMASYATDESLTGEVSGKT